MTCLIVVSILAGCATFPGKQPSKKPGTTTPKTTIERPPNEPPRETMKPVATRYADSTTPKRQVSQQLVAQGKEFLEKKNYDQARQRLDEAVSVDPTNGAAYYHLAVVYYDLKDYPKAIGFLDQAQSLLNASPDWMETIQKFRAIINQLIQ